MAWLRKEPSLLPFHRGAIDIIGPGFLIVLSFCAEFFRKVPERGPQSDGGADEILSGTAVGAVNTRVARRQYQPDAPARRIAPEPSLARRVGIVAFARGVYATRALIALTAGGWLSLSNVHACGYEIRDAHFAKLLSDGCRPFTSAPDGRILMVTSGDQILTRPGRI
jgi:hypothetical protein